MKNKKMKIVGIAIGVILLMFVLLNITWFIWRYNTYKAYINDCKKMEDVSALVPRYYYKDNDGYDYSIKYPNYLSLNGNLAVVLPTDDDHPWVDSLIIWISLNHSYEYGAILYDEKGDGELLEYNIYIDSNGKAINIDDESIVENHRENIDHLLTKAKKYWKQLK